MGRPIDPPERRKNETLSIPQPFYTQKWGETACGRRNIWPQGQFRTHTHTRECMHSVVVIGRAVSLLSTSRRAGKERGETISRYVATSVVRRPIVDDKRRNRGGHWRVGGKRIDHRNSNRRDLDHVQAPSPRAQRRQSPVVLLLLLPDTSSIADRLFNNFHFFRLFLQPNWKESRCSAGGRPNFRATSRLRPSTRSTSSSGTKTTRISPFTSKLPWRRERKSCVCGRLEKKNNIKSFRTPAPGL